MIIPNYFSCEKYSYISKTLIKYLIERINKNKYYKYSIVNILINIAVVTPLYSL